MKTARIGSIVGLGVGLGVLIALPLVTPAYFLHLLIQILLWGFIYTAWSTMGRFGLVSLGHGAFMGVDQRRIYLVTSAIGGALAGLGACLLALQYDVHPFIGNTFGPLIFMICVLGGLGNMIGGFIAAFIISQIIAIGGYYFSTELSYVLAFMLFIVLMFIRPQGIVRR